MAHVATFMNRGAAAIAEEVGQQCTALEAQVRAAHALACSRLSVLRTAIKLKERAKKRQRKGAKKGNAPLDADGLPMEWDADKGEWVQAVGFQAGPEKLSEQWVQTRLSQTLMHLEKLQRGGGVHGTSLINYDELQVCREALNNAYSWDHRWRMGRRSPSAEIPALRPLGP